MYRLHVSICCCLKLFTGSDTKIEIRGINSFNFSNEPLYVIDGVPSQTGMRHLNSADAGNSCICGAGT